MPGFVLKKSNAKTKTSSFSSGTSATTCGEGSPLARLPIVSGPEVPFSGLEGLSGVKLKYYQVGDELEPLPEALKDAADQVGVVEQGQCDQEDVERVPHRFAALKVGKPTA